MHKGSGVGGDPNKLRNDTQRRAEMKVHTGLFKHDRRK